MAFLKVKGYMAKVGGNIRGLPPSLLRQVERLAHRRLDPEELVPVDFAREVYELSVALSRRVGVLVSREGRIEEVFVGSREILYLPPLGRYRLGAGRLRRLRLIFGDLSKAGDPPHLPTDIITDLEKLRLDSVVAVKASRAGMSAAYAYLLPSEGVLGESGSRKESIPDLGRFNLNFQEFIGALEDELTREVEVGKKNELPGAVLISVSDAPLREVEASLDELSELARTAGVRVVDKVMQRKKPDPKSVLGKGKLEEVVLHCLRLGAEVLIFDSELKPSQWRVITNSTELKVLDRSMVILDIFAQRAQSSEGKLQVELAQLRYNLPRLVEQDAGLSRLTGGIGGRGPGETKLELGRRRIKDRIAELERRIDELSGQRAVTRKRRTQEGLLLVCLVGYTNVGKSTLFNRLTKSSVLAENKLFATLDPFKRKLFLPSDDPTVWGKEIIISDTVGFIRDLPEELKGAFRATLEELHDATLLVHVLDAHDPQVIEKRDAVRGILEQMHLSDLEELVVLNKVDGVSEERKFELTQDTEGVPLSALTGEGIDKLLKRLTEELFTPSAPHNEPRV